jgi:hypothetical protein
MLIFINDPIDHTTLLESNGRLPSQVITDGRRLAAAGQVVDRAGGNELEHVAAEEELYITDLLIHDLVPSHVEHHYSYCHPKPTECKNEDGTSPGHQAVPCHAPPAKHARVC